MQKEEISISNPPLKEDKVILSFRSATQHES